MCILELVYGKTYYYGLEQGSKEENPIPIFAKG
jgi:hypothetical protein